MKKTMLVVFCLIMMLCFSACSVYIDTDPWPASPDNTVTAPTITQPPTNTPDHTQSPYSPNSADETMPPKATEEPEAVDVSPAITPTPEPHNEVVEPGFNG